MFHPWWLVCLPVVGALGPSWASSAPPNFVVILCDNLGYGDVGCFGSDKHRTPNIDRLAAQGVRLTHCYATSGVCTPSRASLMTGCYPRRVNLHVDDKGAAVLRPVSSKGLHPDEVTIAEILAARGYRSACIGKWHLGDQPAFLPTRQGFALYLGIPYSDDMTERTAPPWPPLPLLRNERVIEAPVDHNALTARYTAEAVRFITENRERPFFLLLSHAMPGSTRQPFASEHFRGRSANGPYGDAVEEIDWSTGAIIQTLEKLQLDRRTMVIWTSDNGAPASSRGSNAPLAGWGYTTAEGGMRVPCIAWQPGSVSAGRECREVAVLMDLLPTFAALAGAELPADRPLDGKNIWPLLAGDPHAKSPHAAFFYYHMEQLQAVRSGAWKLYLPLTNPQGGRRQDAKPTQARLYDLHADVGETHNLADAHPEIVRRLQSFAEQARADLGDLGRPGRGQRPAGHVDNPQPLVKK